MDACTIETSASVTTATVHAFRTRNSEVETVATLATMMAMEMAMVVAIVDLVGTSSVTSTPTAIILGENASSTQILITFSRVMVSIIVAIVNVTLMALMRAPTAATIPAITPKRAKTILLKEETTTTMKIVDLTTITAVAAVVPDTSAIEMKIMMLVMSRALNEANDVL